MLWQQAVTDNVSVRLRPMRYKTSGRPIMLGSITGRTVNVVNLRN